MAERKRASNTMAERKRTSNTMAERKGDKQRSTKHYIQN
jgi:hypothetical protein